jgi:hypothetical protein
MLIKPQFESWKHLHQTTFQTLKYNRLCFENAYLGDFFETAVVKSSPIGEQLPNLVTLLVLQTSLIKCTVSTVTG